MYNTVEDASSDPVNVAEATLDVTGYWSCFYGGEIFVVFCATKHFLFENDTERTPVAFTTRFLDRTLRDVIQLDFPALDILILF